METVSHLRKNNLLIVYAVCFVASVNNRNVPDGCDKRQRNGIKIIVAIFILLPAVLMLRS